jgi:Raf kinase inhibitor-like YbhB/YbcL family protein
MTLTFTSRAFPAQGPIPKKYADEGEDVFPPLSWSGVPPETEELTLICDDPNAPPATPRVHWVLYAIPPMQGGLSEGAQHDNTGYGGPMPPPGHGVHHHHFHLYALDAAPLVGPALTKEQLLDAMHSHILAEGERMCTCERA